eukprot:GHVN01103042.1.p4 GENE.GHVN01103042.1~~GHVN01103042.1.p4  ORF type:complete len:312 (-),score=58.88 GHVN01103042.1:4029-4964(-)
MHSAKSQMNPQKPNRGEKAHIESFLGRISKAKKSEVRAEYLRLASLFSDLFEQRKRLEEVIYQKEGGEIEEHELEEYAASLVKTVGLLRERVKELTVQSKKETTKTVDNASKTAEEQEEEITHLELRLRRVTEERAGEIDALKKEKEKKKEQAEKIEKLEDCIKKVSEEKEKEAEKGSKERLEFALLEQQLKTKLEENQRRLNLLKKEHIEAIACLEQRLRKELDEKKEENDLLKRERDELTLQFQEIKQTKIIHKAFDKNSSNESKDMERACLQKTFFCFLTKPQQRKELLPILCSLLDLKLNPSMGIDL